MMDKINLDAIITTVSPILDEFLNNPDVQYIRIQVKNMMKEAIHQALVLASEKVKPAFRELKNTEKGWPGKIWSGIDKQSILDVEKLIT